MIKNFVKNLEKLKVMHFITIIIILTALQILLIIAGVIPPLASHSIENLFFDFVGFIVIFLMGFALSKHGLKKVALFGACVTTASFIIVCIALIISSYLYRPILGISVPNLVYLTVILLTSLIFNIVLGVIVAIAGAFIKSVFVPKPKKSKSRR